jgi:hypothetical protein
MVLRLWVMNRTVVADTMRTAARSPTHLFAVTKPFTVGTLWPDPGILLLTSYKCRRSALARTPGTRRHKLHTFDYSSFGHLVTHTNETDLKIVEVAIIGKLGENQLNCLTVIHNRPFFRNVEVTNGIINGLPQKKQRTHEHHHQAYSYTSAE